jgi:hypothetical protein
MKIYQRLLYVGLGGTGLKIGAQLEQILRLEMCGADGRALLQHPPFSGSLSPFELPKFAQFVYADFDERERNGVRTASQRFTDEAAARNSSTFITRLTPSANSYSRVRESLQTACFPLVKDWLPPQVNEPRVSPLQDGAAQFPTVGRAALFETFLKDGRGVVDNPLQQAITRLATSGGDLMAYLGRDTQPRGCDVFVGFSVAGGTGAGLFYDFLHLISERIRQTFADEGPNSNVHIYPLVVLPSAFAGEEKVNYRAAQLNGSQALRELFSLIDDFNTGTERREIQYPGGAARTVRGSVDVQTAFLFNRPEALSIDDLHRSIVAFVRSLVGTEYQQGIGTDEGSFASSFINRAGERNRPAPDGIGHRPVSTALAAQLTIPSEDIAEILAARFVAQAAEQLATPKSTENNRDAMMSFISDAGLVKLQQRAPADALPALPSDMTGATELGTMLRQRRATAVQQIRSQRKRLEAEVPQLAENFSPERAIRSLAPMHDLLRLARVVGGDPRIDSDPINRTGFDGFVRRRMTPVPAPEDATAHNVKFQASEPPPVLTLKNKYGGMKKANQTETTVRETLAQQDAWYQWQTRQEWHTAWNKYRELWDPKVATLRDTLNAISAAFDRHSREEPKRFRESCTRLFSPRQGVVYFLPEGGSGNDLNMFYEGAVLSRLREKYQEPDLGALLNKMIRNDWVTAYQVGLTSPDKAVDVVLDRVREEIHSLLTARGEDRQPPLLPPLSELLAAAASGDPERLADPTVQRLRASLGALRPAGFEPAGTGQLHSQLFYPAAGQSDMTEGFLRNALDDHAADCTPIADANFLAVVLTREAIPATSVEEYRELLRLWADAIDMPNEDDKLAWRQRLRFDSRSVACNEEDRVELMLRLLNAMWDGSIDVLEGTMADPVEIAIRQAESPDAPPIVLRLKAYGTLSRWSNVLRSYERYAIQAGSAVTQRCAQLTKRTTPVGVSDEPAPPSDLYRAFRSIVVEQQRLAQHNYQSVADAAKPVAQQALDFWVDIVPQALEREFVGGGGPRGRNHLTLYSSFEPAPLT